MVTEGDVLSYTKKTQTDIVTDADLLSQKLIIRTIKRAYPDHAVLAEEDLGEEDRAPEGAPAEYTWIVDPLCGSTPYSRGIRDFAISIAVFEGKGLVAGVVYDPPHREMAFAQTGKGAYLRRAWPAQGDRAARRPGEEDERLRVSTTPTLDASMVSVEHKVVREERTSRSAIRVSGDVQRLRVAGTCGLEMAYVAAGQLDALVKARQPIWDYAAGFLLVLEAGGRITDFAGHTVTPIPDPKRRTDFIASNRLIHGAVLKAFANFAS